MRSAAPLVAQDIMWTSEDDIVKDLDFLNDFRTPGDHEPYKFLNQIGLGSKIKKKPKIPQKFIDPRTGEVIDFDGEILEITDTFHKSKGRGSACNSYLRQKSQLEQQLRLARPLGSGDEAIESYCRRNISPGRPKNFTKISDFEPEVPIYTKSDVQFYGTRQRIKAIRNSSLQSNALINNLLSKGNENIKTVLKSEKCGFNNNNGSSNSSPSSSSSSTNSNTNTNTNNEISETKINEYNFIEYEKIKAYDFSDESDSANRCQIDENKVGNERLDHIGKDKENKEKKSTNKIENICCSSFIAAEDIKKEEKRHEKYEKLGERINRSNEIALNSGAGIYGLNQFSGYIAPVDADSDTELAVASNSVIEAFVFNEDEFPPLGKN